MIRVGFSLLGVSVCCHDPITHLVSLTTSNCCDHRAVTKEPSDSPCTSDKCWDSKDVSSAILFSSFAWKPAYEALHGSPVTYQTASGCLKLIQNSESWFNFMAVPWQIVREPVLRPEVDIDITPCPLRLVCRFPMKIQLSFLSF
jgi:hypothetical protein